MYLFFYQRQFPENQAKSDEARVDGVGTGGPTPTQRPAVHESMFHE